MITVTLRSLWVGGSWSVSWEKADLCKIVKIDISVITVRRNWIYALCSFIVATNKDSFLYCLLSRRAARMILSEKEISRGMSK